MKLTSEEKQQVRDTILSYCAGTPLGPHADFASQYLGTWVIQLLENRDNIFKGESDGRTA